MTHHDKPGADHADNADHPDVVEQADKTLQIDVDSAADDTAAKDTAADDTAAYGAYEAENFGPEGDASKN